MEQVLASTPPSINDPVIVTWRDIIATAGWEEEPEIPTLINIGWLVSMDEEKIVIAGCRNQEGEYAAFHCFPSGAVVLLERIGQASSPSETEKLEAMYAPMGQGDLVYATGSNLWQGGSAKKSYRGSSR